MTYWFWLASLASLAKPVSRYALNFILNHYQVGAGKLKWSSEISLSWLVFENPWTLDSGLWEQASRSQAQLQGSFDDLSDEGWRTDQWSVIIIDHWRSCELRLRAQVQFVQYHIYYTLWVDFNSNKIVPSSNRSQFTNLQTLHCCAASFLDNWPRLVGAYRVLLLAQTRSEFLWCIHRTTVNLSENKKPVDHSVTTYLSVVDVVTR